MRAAYKRAGIFTVAIVSALGAAPAAAQPVIDGGWTTFFWNAVGPAQPPFNAFILTSSSPFEVRVTDGFLYGDEFLLAWSGTTVGSLATSPFSGPDGGSSGALTGPVAWATPGLSKGSAIFDPGTYSFTLATTRVALGTAGIGGGAFIEARASVIPEPSTWALASAGAVGVWGVARRRLS